MMLFSQPFDGSLGDYLVSRLESGEFDKLATVVAFARSSGVLRMREAFNRFTSAGGVIDVYVGIDLKGTTYEALLNLLPVVSTVRIIHDENGQTFHTKLFNFTGKDRGELIVGSHNLTGGGLWTNYESSVLLPLDLTEHSGQEIQRSVNDYLSRLRNLDGRVKLVSSEEEIEALLEARYLDREVKAAVRRRRDFSENRRNKPLFSAGERARLPGRASPGIEAKSGTLHPTPLDEFHEVVVPPKIRTSFSGDIPKQLGSQLRKIAHDDSETLWLETRRMTGGSRNILDLSKSSLLRSGQVSGTQYEHEDSRFMKGAVEFFGVDPEDTGSRKEIVINYQGQDYAGNTILFPAGDRANGTWRVQIKGVSASGEKITAAFRRDAEDDYLLPQKVVAFTRVDSDYYSLSVFEATDLPDLLDVSAVTAYNGRTTAAKLLGIL